MEKDSRAEISSRRYACDRCRGHKLRCLRDIGGDSCQRCLKAKVKCNISVGKRVGKGMTAGLDHANNERVSRTDDNGIYATSIDA
jgi:hypothetical protein